MAFLFIIILASYLRILSGATNCSAIHSYIQIVSPSDLIDTLTSSKALFPPYNYYVPTTELVTLDTATDNICNPTGLNTVVSNKIVLIFTTHGLCSNHFKIYVAQQHNATAVILVNHDASGEVVDIAEDSYLETQGFTTSIPVRGISYPEGTLLSNAIAAGTPVTAAFHCFDSIYPTQLCVLDSLGDLWYLDGDYQRQEKLFNGHPVYKKEGYVYLLSHLYIFQYTMSGDTDWHWTITLDPDFTSDKYIRARCAEGGISDPALCPMWNTTNAFNVDKSVAFSFYPELRVSKGLCTISDSYICIESTQSDLRGLDGTYRQFNPQTPFWFRELDDCDTRPGWFLLQDSDFVLLDSLNVWAIAQCEAALGTTDPTLCTQWQSIATDSLIEQLADDETFSITYCTPDTSATTCNPTIAAPEMFCMDKTSVMHGFLEGQYSKTGVLGPKYQSTEYMRTEPLFYDGEFLDIYVWWFGEINPDEHSWWVISKSSLSTAISRGGDVTIYAYCESKTRSPGECAAAWNFYFVSAFHPDFQFEVYDGLCSSGQVTEEREWPDYVCVGFEDDAIGSESSYLRGELFTGAYEINTTATILGQGAPHWVKPKTQDASSKEMYLYFDGFYGYWQIGFELHVEHGAILFCYQEEDYSPMDCNGWYDAWLTKMDNVYVYACGEDDMKHGASKGDRDPGIMIGVVITFCVCCICIFGCFYQMNVRKKGEVSFTHRSSTADAAKDVRADSNAGLAKNAPPIKADFTPLNVESPVSAAGDSSGDENATDFMTKGSDSKPKAEEVELAEEKKEERNGGANQRRKSQEKVKTMKKSLDEWTNAMIEDPKAAARRYSQTNPQEVQKIQTFYKKVMDPLFTEKMKAKKKERRKERRKQLLKDPEQIKKLYRQIMDPLHNIKPENGDNDEEEEEAEEKKTANDALKANEEDEALDPEEIKKLYKKIMDPLYNFEDEDSDDIEMEVEDEKEILTDQEDSDKEDKEVNEKPQTELEDPNAKNPTDVVDDNANVKTDETPAEWTKF